MPRPPVTAVDSVVIRFAGDSGDGMQLTGDRFTAEAASLGNDLATLPDFPAEIRAPAGTLPGVSSFQLQFADHDVLTPGDHPHVLVAMNPAALRANLGDVPRGGTLVVDADAFTKRALAKVGYSDSPLTDGSLDGYDLHAVPLTSLTVEALAGLGLGRKDAERSRNMFALGLLSWLYSRPTDGTRRFLEAKFDRRPELLKANLTALEAGWSFGETTETFAVRYEVAAATPPPGRYRNVTGNVALSYGLVAAARRAGLPLVLGSYPITPASDILHTLSRLKRFGVTTLQVEDEIAGIGAALGAAYGGAVGVTTTSGPGLSLKGEMLGLAVALELPLVLCDVQRGGPSTGLPTKTEQADLLQALFGRHGEAPLPVVAAATPADCFDMALEAVRIATTHMTPVVLLSDGYLANGAEPWHLPRLADLPDLRTRRPTGEDRGSGPDGGEKAGAGSAGGDRGSRTVGEATRAGASGGGGRFLPYSRDPETLARPWAVPGTAGLEHRIGGLEKADGTGDISYDPANHERMVRLRQAKIDAVAVPDLAVDDPWAVAAANGAVAPNGTDTGSNRAEAGAGTAANGAVAPNGTDTGSNGAAAGAHDAATAASTHDVTSARTTVTPGTATDRADVLVLGWGSTYGPAAAAVREARAGGIRVAQAHLRHLNPFPGNLGDVLRAYRTVLVPEMNLGQLALLLRARYLVDVVSHTAVRGQPFTAAELVEAIGEAASGAEAAPGVSGAAGSGAAGSDAAGSDAAGSDAAGSSVAGSIHVEVNA